MTNETGGEGRYDALKLSNQLCFPLYATSKELTRRYAPILAELDLTYTQYIALMVLWEEGSLSVKDLGRRLLLDSGTLTPLLKKLEAKGYVLRERDPSDERRVIVSLTPAGTELRERALAVPQAIGQCVELSREEAVQLRALLDKVLAGFEEGEAADGR